MKRNLAIFSVVAAIIIGAIVLSPSSATKTTVFFSAPHVATNQATPPTVNAAFDVTNTAAQAVFLQVAAIERQSASVWLADTQALPVNTFRTLGMVGARGTSRLSLELPYESSPIRLRVLVSPDATAVQKARFALRRLWANVRGQGQYKQLWVRDLAVPSYQVITPELP